MNTWGQQKELDFWTQFDVSKGRINVRYVVKVVPTTPDSVM